MKIVIDTRRSTQSGKYPVRLYLYLKGKQLYLSTGLEADITEWGDGLFLTKSTNYKAKNALLSNILTKAENLILALQNENKLSSMSIDAIKRQIEESVLGKRKSRLFVDVATKFATECKKPRTKQIYMTTIEKVRSFDSSATFESITKNWMSMFEQHLLNQGLNINGISVHLRNIRAVFNYALDEEITKLYPFRKFKIKSENKLSVDYLTFDQLREFMDYPLPKHYAKARDMFMLMFYLCGINLGDLAMIKEIHNGRINYKRQKTGRMYSVKVEPEAMEIIERYKGKNYLIDLLDTYKNYTTYKTIINKYLKCAGPYKRVGKGGVKQINPLHPKMTAYWARYTWGTLAGQLDIPKETISAGLGHGARSVTDNYVHFDIKKVDEANRRILDKLKE